MTQAQTSSNEIRDLIKNAQTILVASHIRPDGDAIGSILGMGLALRELGKTVSIVLSDGVPSNFNYLPGRKTIVRSVNAKMTFDLTISLDASDPDRLGSAMGGREIDLQIDHHITNVNFGKYNFVDPVSVATSAVISKHLDDWALPVNAEIATVLLTGILTDTIGFRTSNMNSDTLRISANLMDYGANLPELYHEALVGRTFEQVSYWGNALIRLKNDNTLVWTTLTLADRQQAGYNGNDDADLNTLLSSISESRISLLFVEQNNGHVKVSWRSKPGVDVSQLAFSLGGGGHPAASGADLPGDLESVQKLVLEKTLAYLDSISNLDQKTQVRNKI